MGKAKKATVRPKGVLLGEEVKPKKKYLSEKARDSLRDTLIVVMNIERMHKKISAQGGLPEPTSLSKDSKKILYSKKMKKLLGGTVVGIDSCSAPKEPLDERFLNSLDEDDELTLPVTMNYLHFKN